MNKNIVYGGILIAIVLAVSALFFGGTKTIVKEVPQDYGAGGTRFPNGLSTDSTSPSAGQLRTSTLTVTGASTLTGAVAVGSSGTSIAGINTGTCYLNFGNVPASISATTTTTVDCQASNMLATATTVQSALAGVTAGDKVFLTMPTTTPTTFTSSFILSANASSTAGYITVKFMNGTGGAFTPATTTVAGVQYFVTR